MVELNAYYRNEDDEEEQEERQQSGGDYKSTGRDSLVFLVDASKEMFIKGEDGQSFNFDMTMQVVRSVYTSKIISSHRDLMALVFFGTEQSKNPTKSFKHVYVYHDLDEPGAKRVQDVDALRGGERRPASGGETCLGDALWCCANLYSDIKLRLSHKRLMIFTCRDEPHEGDSVKDRQARTKAGDLKETGPEAAQMDENEDDEEEQEEGEQEEGDYKSTGRDSLVFLVDASKEMFIKGEDGQPSNFDMTMQVVRSVYTRKIISSHRDLMALVFFGTEQSKNPTNSFKHVYVYHDLDEPGAKRVQDVDGLRGEKGAQLAAKTMGSGETSLRDALWCCANLYSGIKIRLSHKQLMIFTCRDEPHEGDSVKDRQARTKAGDLKETGVIIDLIHLLKPGGFDVAPFFRDIVSPPEDERELGLQLEPCDKLEDLQKRVRAKEHKKRAMARINLCLGEGINVAVGIYATAVKASKPATVRLYSKTNEPVRSKTRIFHTQTGSLLLPSEIKKSQTYGKKQIVMERDEVDAIKKFEDPGMSLIGFKPMERLKRHHHIRPAVFLYPEEEEVKGSACLFSALLTKCSERKVFALCRCVSRRNDPPRFVALVPQKEEVDEGKVQITPPGFNVIYLPYADDIRTLDLPRCPSASQTQVDKMKEIVSKLRFKYRSDAFENPVIQQQYRNLEALALDMMAPEDIEDLIMPKVDQMDRCLGPLVQEFKDLVYPDDYNPDSKPAAKRKAADAGGGAEKKPKVEVPEDELREHVQNGTLAKLTVPVLKEACKQFGVRTTGTKKQELMDALIAKLGP